MADLNKRLDDLEGALKAGQVIAVHYEGEDCARVNGKAVPLDELDQYHDLLLIRVKYVEGLQWPPVD